MSKAIHCFIIVLLSGFASMAGAKETRISDAAIVQKLIEASIDAYPGNCPCPYNSARNGSRCGKRSAYNRAGGYAPLCFKDDVTPAMVRAYRERTKP